MKRIWFGFLVVVLLALAVVAPGAQAADAQDFVVESFDADYYLTRDDKNVSQLRVVERIVARFPEYDQNHGILRAIPETYQGHSVDVKVLDVSDGSGRQWGYSASSSNDNRVLKIGDASRYVHGRQTYQVAYTMSNVTQHFEDHEEFYWDVNGDQWSQPFGRVTARVHLPTELAAAQNNTACFAGVQGSTDTDCTVEKQEDGQLVSVVATRPLRSGETLTFVLGFNGGTFAAYTIPMSTIALWAAGIVVLGVLPPLLAAWFVLVRWRRYGRDAKGRGVIVPEYLPPKAISVIGSQIVLKEKFEPLAISAQIIDLAVGHVVKVYETKTKKLLGSKVQYELELTHSPHGLRPEERAVVAALFGEGAAVGARVDMSTLKNKLHTKAQTIGKTVSARLAVEGYFRADPTAIKMRYIVAGSVLLVIGFVFPPFTLGLSLAGVLVLGASRLMPARTEKGVEMRDYLRGLKVYMKLAEAERLKVLQSPQGSLTEKVQIDPDDKKQLVKLYEKLLPYAMLFGIEEEWAKQFADLYQTQPDWYSGSGAFHAAVFASSLHSFGVASAASFTPPSSSSSSGFGGGGFSGGGGGGGGGGGW